MVCFRRVSCPLQFGGNSVIVAPPGVLLSLTHKQEMTLARFTSDFHHDSLQKCPLCLCFLSGRNLPPPRSPSFIFSPSHLPSVFFPQSLLFAFVFLSSLCLAGKGLVMNRQGGGWSRIHKSNRTGERARPSLEGFSREGVCCGEEPGLPLPPPSLLVFAMAVGRSERTGMGLSERQPQCEWP